MILKNKKMALGLLSMLLINSFFGVKAQGNLDSISPNRSVTFTTTSQYPWTATRTNGKWIAKSGNHNVNSSVSSIYATVVVPSNAVDADLCFTYRVSSQASYDKLWVYVDGIAIDGFSTGQSGTVAETFVTVPLTMGTHYVEWTYEKNPSTHSGEDAAFLSNVYLSIGRCVRPDSIVLNTASDTSANISWNGVSEANIEYGVQGFTRGTGFADYVTDTFYTLTFLQPNTYYTVWVQNVCPNGDTSVWVPFTFRTACSPYTVLPYTQDFESWTSSSSITSTIDPCWSRQTNYQYSTIYPYVNTSYSHSGTKSMYFYGSSNNPYALLVLPQFADTIQNLQVSFWMYSGSSSYRIEVGVMTNPDDISTFVPVSSVYNTTYNTWVLNEVSLNSYTGQGRYIAFKTPSTIYTYCYIDDITVERIPLCRRPTNLSVRNITSNSASLTWTAYNASSCVVEYGYPGFPLGSGTRIQTTGMSANLTNLSPATNYEVYVTSNCNNGSTNISSPFYFHTSCGKISTVPFVENFEGLGTGLVTSKLPCWKAYSMYSSSSYPAIYSQGGSNALEFYIYRSSTTISDMYAYIATPPIDTNVLPLRTLQVSFKLLRPNTSYMHELAFGVMTDSSDITTFDTLDLIHLSNSGIWNDFTYDLSNYHGDARFIAFKSSVYGTQYYSYPYIDDIVIDKIITCPKPTDVQVLSSFDPNDIQISWTSWPAQADSWDLVYGPHGFSPYLSGTRINGITDTFYTLTGLNIDSTYDVYVRSHCGSNDSSMWCETPANVIPGTVIIPRSGTQTYYLCDAMVYDNGGGNGNYTDNNNGTIIIYPITTDSVISITGTYATEQSYDYITVYDGAGTSGTQLARVSGSGNLSVTSTIGPLTISFTSDLGVTMSGFALHARCVAPPHCRRPIPTVLNVESRRATIDVVSSPANSWIMNFSTTASFTPGTGSGTTIDRGSSSFTVTGLQPRTTYYAYICTDCGGGDTSQWSYRFSFTTPCDPETVLPYREDFTSLNLNQRRQCWSHSANYPLTRVWHSSTTNKAYYFNGNAGVVNYASIHKIANIPVRNLHVKFSLFGQDTNPVFSVGVMTNPSDYSTFTPVTSFNVRDEYNWYNYDISLSSYSSGEGYIAFSAVNPTNKAELYFDNLVVDTVSSCQSPIIDTIITTNNMASIVLVNSGAVGWIMEYGQKGYQRGSGTGYIFYTPTINIPGLQPNTEYDVYLRAICGQNDTSDWSLNPIHISTTCQQRTLPYSENFDRYNGTPYSKYTRSMPTCWSIVSSTAHSSRYRPQVYKDNAYSLNGTSSLVLSTPSTVASPVINASIDTVEAEFFMRVDDVNTGLIVGVVEDLTADSSFVAIDTVMNTLAGAYQQHSVVFNTYSGTAQNIAFRKYSLHNSDTMRVFMDSLLVHPIDPCVRPSHIVVSDVTAHTARVAWTERGTATSWIIEYDTVGYTPGTGTQIMVNTNPYLLTGLDSNRSYSVNVRSICNDTSEWCTMPAEFLLPRCDESCQYTLYMNSLTSGWYGASVEVSYNEQYDVSYTILNNAGIATIIACPEEILSFSWRSGSFDNNCSFTLMKDDDTLYTTTSTPQPGLFFTTTCGSDTACHDAINLTTTFIDYQTVEAGWYGTGTFAIACKIQGDTTYFLTDTVTTNSYVNTYRIDSLHPDTNYVWMVQKLCFIDSVSSWQINRFKIADNMCVVPINLSVTRVSHDGANIQWDAFANNISWGVRCFSTANNYDTIIYTTNKYVNITGLYAGLPYKVSVMGLCRDSANSIWSDTVDFVTTVCDTVRNVTVSSINDNGATVTWTRAQGPSNWEVDYGRTGFPEGYGTIRQTTSPTYNITGLQPGTTYDVYVRTLCGTDFFSVWSMRVTFTTTGISSIEEAEGNDVEMSIIPNPANKTSVITAQGIDGKTVITITAVSGKTVSKEKVTCNGLLEKTIDVSQMAKGTYFVHVSNDKVNVVQKLIVQ